MKALIFDSGTLINLSMNGLLYILEPLKKQFQGKFLITDAVKHEVVDKPVKIPRFELGALRIQDLLDKKVIELCSALDIPKEQVGSRTQALLKEANHIVKAKGKWIQIVSEAEISCLALSALLTKRGIENLIAIDERTTRILAENPKNLGKIISKKMHQQVSIAPHDFRDFKEFRFIRSSELVYVAAKKQILKIKDPKALEAVLYATKYKGSSISHDEINALKKL